MEEVDRRRQVIGLPRCRLLSPPCDSSSAVTGLMENGTTYSTVSFRVFEEFKKHAFTVTVVKWGLGAKLVGGKSVTKQVLLVKKQDIGQQQVGSQQKQTWPEGNRQAARNQKELAGFRITTPAGIRYRKQGCKKGNLKMLGITVGWVTVWGWWENGLVGFSSK